MAEGQTGEENAHSKEKGLTEGKIKDKEKSLDELKEDLLNLTAEFRKKSEDLNQEIYNQGADEFSDVNLEDLLVKGEAFHESEILKINFKLKSLTKAESIEVDKLAKQYMGETREHYTSGVQSDVLAFALKEYAGNKAPEKFEGARNAVTSISNEVIDLIWSKHSRMTRWIKAALELNLKN